MMNKNDPRPEPWTKLLVNDIWNYLLPSVTTACRSDHSVNFAQQDWAPTSLSTMTNLSKSCIRVWDLYAQCADRLHARMSNRKDNTETVSICQECNPRARRRDTHAAADFAGAGGRCHHESSIESIYNSVEVLIQTQQCGCPHRSAFTSILLVF